jgi:hypothetical protein
MARKANFTSDEWSKILNSTLFAGMAVTAAEPSGLIGLLQEGMAGGRLLMSARSDTSANDLVRDIATEFGNMEAMTRLREGLQSRLSTGKRPEEMKNIAIQGLREAASVVEAKAPADAAAFKSWLRKIAEETANAAKEGGFLGFGGTPVSEKERATLAEIGQALGST